MKTTSSGFSILEIVIALTILASISVISTRLIQSSLETKKMSESKLAEIKELSLASTIIRSDLESALEVELKNMLGQAMDTRFLLDQKKHEMTWISLKDAQHYNGSPVRRLKYQFKDSQLFRKQYFAEHPAEEKYIETVILKNISHWHVELFFQNKWFKHWPVGSVQKNKLPQALKVRFQKNNKDYEWLIHVGRFNG